MKKSKFVKISLEYNFPEDFNGDKGEYDFNSGSYGDAIIYLTNPEIFIITDEGECDNIYWNVKDIIIPKLKENYGEGPYTIENIESDDIKDALTNEYLEGCRTYGAFVSMYVDYVDWDYEDEIVQPSEKLKQMEIPGISLFQLLKKMDK